MPKTSTKKDRGTEQRAALLETLKARFEANMARHEGMQWAKVQARSTRA